MARVAERERRKERERQEVKAVPAKRVRRDTNNDEVVDSEEHLKGDLVEEVWKLLTMSTALPSNVKKAFNAGNLRPHDIAEGIPLTKIPEDLGVAISNAIMVKFPKGDQGRIEDECCDVLGQAVLNTIGSEYWCDIVQPDWATWLLSTIHQTRENQPLQQQIVARYTAIFTKGQAEETKAAEEQRVRKLKAADAERTRERVRVAEE